jgi:GTPase SAR1 family protein
LELYDEWDTTIKTLGKRDNEGSLPNTSADITPRDIHLSQDDDAAITLIPEPPVSNHLKALNDQQRMAHDIVVNNLDAHLAGKFPPQLLMAVFGQGGTGKSTLLNAISISFENRRVSQLLAKTAMSGVATSLIGGSTLHWWAGLPTRQLPQGNEWMSKSGKDIKACRIQNITDLLWLSIDETGMLTTDLLTYLSQVAGTVRTGNGRTDSTIALGGLNLMITGDFHQFPPVGHADVALYSTRTPRDSSVIGQNIYQQIDTVIILEEQKRITDLIWKDLLQRAQTGACTRTDLVEIRKLIVTNAHCEVPDLSCPPWSEATLITPRNSVRTLWNNTKLRQHCAQTGNLLYVVNSEDTGGRHR